MAAAFANAVNAAKRETMLNIYILDSSECVNFIDCGGKSREKECMSRICVGGEMSDLSTNFRAFYMFSNREVGKTETINSCV